MPLLSSIFTVEVQLIFFGTILICCFISGWVSQYLTRKKWQHSAEQHISRLNAIIAEKDDRVSMTQEKLEHNIALLGKAQAQADRLVPLEEQFKDSQRKSMEMQLALSKSNAMQQALSAQTQAEKLALQDKIELLETSESRLKTQFENLANKIFEDRSEKLTTQNLNQLDTVLNPLKLQLEGFRQQVRESYTQEQSERSALKHQLIQLQQLNLKMSQDAVNLTKALKGDNKQQGNWGEIILERVLQESGLRNNHEYHIQQDLKDDAGKHFKPDVIVHLPEDKDIIIDSKVSLLDYERYFNSDDPKASQQAIKQHLASIRNHINQLSNKNYQKLHGVKSLDYVLMFVPIEPAFLLALEQDPSLVNYALERNIMLVSPTNLLVALRTINNIWRYEYQNQHSQRIASQGAKIYDKLCGFVEDMDKLGRTLDSAHKGYQSAMNKLSVGKGNLIRQAHQMHQFGLDTSKQLDNQLIEKSLDNTQETYLEQTASEATSP